MKPLPLIVTIIGYNYIMRILFGLKGNQFKAPSAAAALRRPAATASPSKFLFGVFKGLYRGLCIIRLMDKILHDPKD